MPDETSASGSPVRLRPAPSWLALLPALAAFLIDLLPLWKTGNWSGVFSFDDGVYVSSAVELVHGVVPYKDFVFVQPPGITLLLSPAAEVIKAVGVSTARVVTVARILTAVVTAAGAGLGSYAIRHRGALGMLVAGIALACYPLAYTADSATFLEPYLNLFVLLGVVALFKAGKLSCGGWRPYVGGAMFGLALGFKLWAVIPMAVAFVACARVDWRGSLRLVAGFLAGAALIFGPFLVMSPGALVREVVFAQADRVQLTSFKVIADRFGAIFGPSYLRLPLAVVVPALIAWAALVVTAHRRRQKADPGRLFDRFLLAVTVPVLVLLFAAAPFYSHYSFIVAPWVSMLLGSVVARALAPGPASRSSSMARGGWLVVQGVTIALCVALAVPLTARELQVSVDKRLSVGYETQIAVLSEAPEGSCVVTDEVAVALSANRLSTGADGCPVLVDSDGIRLNNIAADGTSRSAEMALAAKWRGWFSHADYVYLSPLFRRRIPWPPTLSHWFHKHFKLIVVRHRVRYGSTYRRR